MPNVDCVAYGAIADMVAEFGALEMPADWLAEHGFTHCAMVVGDAQFDTEYATSLAEAKALAAEQATYFNVKLSRA